MLFTICKINFKSTICLVYIIEFNYYVCILIQVENLVSMSFFGILMILAYVYDI